MESQPADELLRDPLTGLPNGVLLRDRLRVALIRRRRPRDDSLAVLSVDIDGMAAFNGKRGRDAGDRLIQAAAVRLSELVRAGDTVARAGGDEFVMICEELTGVSVGLVVVAGGEIEPDRVLTEAHRAMLRARGDDPGRFGS